MGLIDLPPELQLHVFGYLVDDYMSLRALVFVSRHLITCTLEVLRESRTLDLSAGFTDKIEEVLMKLYTLGNDANTPAPDAAFTSTGSSFGDRIIRHGSRYNTLKLAFVGRDGVAHGPPVDEQNMRKLEAMSRAVSGDDSYDISTWRVRMRLRRADTSIRLLLHTMLHITTLELSRSTNMLPWFINSVLPFLHTLKFKRITNSNLSLICSRLASDRPLVTLEFACMSIDSSFFKHLKDTLSIKILRFKQCWVGPTAVGRVLELCRDLEVFQYSIPNHNQPAELITSKHLHLYRLLAKLQPHTNTLTELTLLVPDIANTGSHCSHVASLAQFSALRKLVIDHKLLAPHMRPCNVGGSDVWQQESTITAPTILSGLSSLEELHLRCNKKMPVFGTLLAMANAAPTVLPNLRRVDVMLPWRLGDTFVRVPGPREAAARQALKDRGVEVRVSRRKPSYIL